jgi:hypothetical protein
LRAGGLRSGGVPLISALATDLPRALRAIRGARAQRASLAHVVGAIGFAFDHGLAPVITCSLRAKSLPDSPVGSHCHGHVIRYALQGRTFVWVCLRFPAGAGRYSSSWPTVLLTIWSTSEASPGADDEFIAAAELARGGGQHLGEPSSEAVLGAGRLHDRGDGPDCKRVCGGPLMAHEVLRGLRRLPLAYPAQPR